MLQDRFVYPIKTCVLIPLSMQGLKTLLLKTGHDLYFDPAEAFTNFVYETASPVQVLLSNQSMERKKEILKAITEAVTRYADRDSDSVRFKNEDICIVGRT